MIFQICHTMQLCLSLLAVNIKEVKDAKTCWAVSWQGSCYGWINQTLPHQGAMSYCLSQKSDLLWIENEEEQAFIKDYVIHYRWDIFFVTCLCLFVSLNYINSLGDI